MAATRQPRTGSFAEPREELLSLFSVQPHQIEAAMRPQQSIWLLTGQRALPRHKAVRIFNDFRSDRPMQRRAVMRGGADSSDSESTYINVVR